MNGFLDLRYQSGPVRERLQEWRAERPEAYARLALDLQALAAEGLRSRRITLRPLGQGLWELKRLHDGIQYRIFFSVEAGRAWLLHAMEKKSAKTPLHDIRLARRRMRELDQ